MNQIELFEKAQEIVTLCRRYKSKELFVKNPSNNDHEVIIPLIKKHIKRLKIKILLLKKQNMYMIILII